MISQTARVAGVLLAYEQGIGESRLNGHTSLMPHDQIVLVRQLTSIYYQGSKGRMQTIVAVGLQLLHWY